MGFDIGAAVGGIGMNLVNNAIQYYTQKNQQRQAQANTQKNMRLQQQLEDESWYNRIAKSTSALKAAGLSPVLATGATQGAAAVSHNESMPQVSAHDSTDLVNAAMLNESQVKLNEAAADKAQAEADKLKQETSHGDTRDFFINSHLNSVLQDIADNADDEFTKDFARSFMEQGSNNNIRFDFGALDAFEKIFFGLEHQKRSHLIEELTNHFDRKVMQMQLTNGAAAALANLHKDQRRLIYKQMMQMDANISKLASDVSLNDKQKLFLTEQIKKTGQEITAMLHNDPVAMYNAGDIGDLAVKLGFEGTSQFMHGAGFGLGFGASQLLTKGKGAGAFASTSLPGTDLFKGSGFSPEKIPVKPKGVEPRQLKLHRLEQELEKMRSDGTKYFKPNIYQKKLDEYEKFRFRK